MPGQPMAFFSVPSRPVPADIADAFSLAIMTGWVARGHGAAGPRPSLEDAFDALVPHGSAIKQVCSRWEQSAQALGPDAASGSALQAAVVLACSGLTALVGRQVPTEQALEAIDGMRDGFLQLGQALSQESSPETSALVVGGAFQGLVSQGQAPAAALEGALSRRKALLGEASELGAINQQRFGEEGTPQRLNAVAHLFGASLAGLVAQGESVSEALAEVHAHGGPCLQARQGWCPHSTPSGWCRRRCLGWSSGANHGRR